MPHRVTGCDGTGFRRRWRMGLGQGCWSPVSASWLQQTGYLYVPLNTTNLWLVGTGSMAIGDGVILLCLSQRGRHPPQLLQTVKEKWDCWEERPEQGCFKHPGRDRRGLELITDSHTIFQVLPIIKYHCRNSKNILQGPHGAIYNRLIIHLQRVTPNLLELAHGCSAELVSSCGHLSSPVKMIHHGD